MAVRNGFGKRQAGPTGYGGLTSLATGFADEVQIDFRPLVEAETETSSDVREPAPAAESVLTHSGDAVSIDPPAPVESREVPPTVTEIASTVVQEIRPASEPSALPFPPPAIAVLAAYLVSAVIGGLVLVGAVALLIGQQSSETAYQSPASSRTQLAPTPPDVFASLANSASETPRGTPTPATQLPVRRVENISREVSDSLNPPQPTPQVSLNTAAASVPVAPAPRPTGNVVERAPAAGSDRALSAEELLFCISEKERIALIKKMLDKSTKRQRRAFHLLADNFNVRCAKFRYNKSDMESARVAFEEHAKNLAKEATEIFRGWK